MTAKTARRTQAERSGATIGDLLDAAETLFTEHGYASTSIDDIVRVAGFTRGALYHHFESKAAVFEAVFERQQQRLVENQVRKLSNEADVLIQLRRGCELFLEDTLDPSVRRISILDAPTALGWDRMREIEGRYLLALLDASLANAAETGRMHPGDRQVRLHLLFGALCEIAVYVARAKSQKRALESARAEITRLLDGFEKSPSRSAATPRPRSGAR